MSIHLPFAIAALVLVGVATPGLSDEIELSLRGEIERKLELPGHRSLVETQSSPGSILAPFTTDGCSGGMSAGWKFVAARFPDFRELHQDSPPWESCCITHDQSYHSGGLGLSADESFIARLNADRELQSCVEDWADKRTEELGEDYGLTPVQVETVYSAIANAMFLSVRMGGAPCTGLSWRWGYGWPDCELALMD